MTNRQFLKRLISLTYKLGNSADKYGYRSDEYNAVLDDIHETGVRFNRHMLLWYFLTKASIVLLVCVLAWCFYTIFHYLKI